jgi:hypothetical protein
MTTLAVPPPSTTATPAPEVPMRLGRQHLVAALAILFVLFTPYQTLVQTVITDDAVRKGIEADEYDMTWIAPVFRTDEIEGLDLRDRLYAGALGIIGQVVPIITIPTATGNVVKEWSDRALDVSRHNLRENRPAIEQASARMADYFHQRGLSGAGLQRETSRVLGTFVTLESLAHGFRSGLRLLSLIMLGIGLVVAFSLAWTARGLRVPPGSGYT